jgi:alkane 1-monooxygenase
MGEPIYRFVLREILGGFRRGWAAEAARLARSKRPAWSTGNQILRSWAVTVVVAAALLSLFGWIMIPFILLHHAYAWYGLTQANYVEHYGLLRRRLASGAYEPADRCHSWNTNHVYSNIISFHLQRHSDHHANSSRPYQVLRDVQEAPHLPSGYPGCFALAAIPFLWFRVMNPRLLRWAGGDLGQVNIDPARRRQLYERYGIPRP